MNQSERWDLLVVSLCKTWCVVNNYCRVSRLVILLIRKNLSLTFKKLITQGKTHDMEKKQIINMAINVFVFYPLFCCSSIQERNLYE